MTTRTLAANAAASPTDTLDRSKMLASAGAAAVLAAIGAPAAAAMPLDADAALMALRAPYESTLAIMDHFAKPHSRAEDSYFALRRSSPDGDDRAWRKQSGLTLAERHYNRATNANLKVIHRIAETQARTLAGFIFKAEVSQREGNTDLDLLASIVADLTAIGDAHPALGI